MSQTLNLTKWQTIAKCDLQCPPQSHYETCPSSYPSVCLDSQEYFNSLCDDNYCLETCVCKEGLQLSMGACVPSNQCGCSWSGGYYPSGAEFLSSDCSIKCQCIGSEETVECHPAQGCDVGLRCELVSGSWSCNPSPYRSCFVLGDLRYLAFDGQQHQFQGSCLSKLAGLSSSHPGLEYFELYFEKRHKEGDLSYTKTAILKIYGINVTISQDEEEDVEVDGHLMSLPFVLNGKSSKVA
ncbi:zonadhesin-like isoform X2 [Xenopus laevis]|uniref:Zonadhesin-like isoform X2 n=1 Tax=Xenopus laevis TaxID=8355 RepID=A0A8J1L862_XENLA|nr:zonadhesin-like isoform X2 [Xenopus laevis]